MFIYIYNVGIKEIDVYIYGDNIYNVYIKQIDVYIMMFIPSSCIHYNFVV